MSTLTILLTSIVAAYSIMRTRTVFRFFILAVLTLFLVPNHIKTVKLASNFDPNNAFHYISKSDYDFLTSISRISRPGEIFLVSWPYNEMFPALTGRTSFHGHPLLTIDADRKNGEARRLFGGTLRQMEITSYLKSNNIRYIIAPPWVTHVKELSGLTLIKGTDTLVLYRVGP